MECLNSLSNRDFNDIDESAHPISLSKTNDIKLIKGWRNKYFNVNNKENDVVIKKNCILLSDDLKNYINDEPIIHDIDDINLESLRVILSNDHYKKIGERIKRSCDSDLIKNLGKKIEVVHLDKLELDSINAEIVNNELNMDDKLIKSSGRSKKGLKKDKLNASINDVSWKEEAVVHEGKNKALFDKKVDPVRTGNVTKLRHMQSSYVYISRISIKTSNLKKHDNQIPNGCKQKPKTLYEKRLLLEGRSKEMMKLQRVRAQQTTKTEPFSHLESTEIGNDLQTKNTGRLLRKNTNNSNSPNGVSNSGESSNRKTQFLKKLYKNKLRDFRLKMKKNGLVTKKFSKNITARKLKLKAANLKRMSNGPVYVKPLARRLTPKMVECLNPDLTHKDVNNYNASRKALMVLYLGLGRSLYQEQLNNIKLLRKNDTVIDDSWAKFTVSAVLTRDDPKKLTSFMVPVVCPLLITLMEKCDKFSSKYNFSSRKRCSISSSNKNEHLAVDSMKISDSVEANPSSSAKTDVKQCSSASSLTLMVSDEIKVSKEPDYLERPSTPVVQENSDLQSTSYVPNTKKFQQNAEDSPAYSSSSSVSDFIKGNNNPVLEEKSSSLSSVANITTVPVDKKSVSETTSNTIDSVGKVTKGKVSYVKDRMFDVDSIYRIVSEVSASIAEIVDKAKNDVIIEHKESDVGCSSVLSNYSFLPIFESSNFNKCVSPDVDTLSLANSSDLSEVSPIKKSNIDSLTDKTDSDALSQVSMVDSDTSEYSATKKINFRRVVCKNGRVKYTGKSRRVALELRRLNSDFLEIDDNTDNSVANNENVDSELESNSRINNHIMPENMTDLIPEDIKQRLAKVEKEYHQTVMKSSSEIIFLSSYGERTKRQKKLPKKLEDAVLVGESEIFESLQNKTEGKFKELLNMDEINSIIRQRHSKEEESKNKRFYKIRSNISCSDSVSTQEPASVIESAGEQPTDVRNFESKNCIAPDCKTNNVPVSHPLNEICSDMKDTESLNLSETSMNTGANCSQTVQNTNENINTVILSDLTNLEKEEVSKILSHDDKVLNTTNDSSFSVVNEESRVSPEITSNKSDISSDNEKVLNCNTALNGSDTKNERGRMDKRTLMKDILSLKLIRNLELNNPNEDFSYTPENKRAKVEKIVPEEVKSDSDIIILCDLTNLEKEEVSKVLSHDDKVLNTTNDSSFSVVNEEGRVLPEITSNKSDISSDDNEKVSNCNTALNGSDTKNERGRIEKRTLMKDILSLKLKSNLELNNPNEDFVCTPENKRAQVEKIVPEEVKSDSEVEFNRFSLFGKSKILKNKLHHSTDSIAMLKNIYAVDENKIAPRNSISPFKMKTRTELYQNRPYKMNFFGTSKKFKEKTVLVQTAKSILKPCYLRTSINSSANVADSSQSNCNIGKYHGKPPFVQLEKLKLPSGIPVWCMDHNRHNCFCLGIVQPKCDVVKKPVNRLLVKHVKYFKELSKYNPSNESNSIVNNRFKYFVMNPKILQSKVVNNCYNRKKNTPQSLDDLVGTGSKESGVSVYQRIKNIKNQTNGEDKLTDIIPNLTEEVFIDDSDVLVISDSESDDITSKDVRESDTSPKIESVMSLKPEEFIIDDKDNLECDNGSAEVGCNSNKTFEISENNTADNSVTSNNLKSSPSKESDNLKSNVCLNPYRFFCVFMKYKFTYIQYTSGKDKSILIQYDRLLDFIGIAKKEKKCVYHPLRKSDDYIFPKKHLEPFGIYAIPPQNIIFFGPYDMNEPHGLKAFEVGLKLIQPKSDKDLYEKPTQKLLPFLSPLSPKDFITPHALGTWWIVFKKCSSDSIYSLLKGAKLFRRNLAENLLAQNTSSSESISNNLELDERSSVCNNDDKEKLNDCKISDRNLTDNDIPPVNNLNSNKIKNDFNISGKLCKKNRINSSQSSSSNFSDSSKLPASTSTNITTFIPLNQSNSSLIPKEVKLNIFERKIKSDTILIEKSNGSGISNMLNNGRSLIKKSIVTNVSDKIENGTTISDEIKKNEGINLAHSKVMTLTGVKTLENTKLNSNPDQESVSKLFTTTPKKSDVITVSKDSKILCGCRPIDVRANKHTLNNDNATVSFVKTKTLFPIAPKPSIILPVNSSNISFEVNDSTSLCKETNVPPLLLKVLPGGNVLSTILEAKTNKDGVVYYCSETATSKLIVSAPNSMSTTSPKNKIDYDNSSDIPLTISNVATDTCDSEDDKSSNCKNSLKTVTSSPVTSKTSENIVVCKQSDSSQGTLNPTIISSCEIKKKGSILVSKKSLNGDKDNKLGIKHRKRKLSEISPEDEVTRRSKHKKPSKKLSISNQWVICRCIDHNSNPTNTMVGNNSNCSNLSPVISESEQSLINKESSNLENTLNCIVTALPNNNTAGSSSLLHNESSSSTVALSVQASKSSTSKLSVNDKEFTSVPPSDVGNETSLSIGTIDDRNNEIEGNSSLNSVMESSQLQSSSSLSNNSPEMESDIVGKSGQLKTYRLVSNCDLSPGFLESYGIHFSNDF